MTAADLIARLEAAREGSRELDAEIDLLALECGWRKERSAAGWMPAYTTSIDAAMTLLADEWDCQIARFGESVGKCHAWVWPGRLGVLAEWAAFEAHAPTLPLALCIAALMASSAP